MEGGVAPPRGVRPLRRACLSAAVALALASPLMPRVAAAAGAVPDGTDEMRVVGRLPVVTPPHRQETGVGWYAKDQMLVVNSVRRRAYEFFQLDLPPDSTSDPAVGIRSFDLDSLAPEGFVSFEAHVLPQEGEWIHTADPQGGRIYLVAQGSNVLVLDEERIERGKNPVLKTIPIPAEQRLLLEDKIPGLVSSKLDAISFFRDRQGRAKLLLRFLGHLEWATGATAGIVGVSIPFVAQWDVETGAGDWLLELTGCRNGRQVIEKTTSLPLLRTSDGRRLYTLCNQSANLAAAVRIALGPDGSPVEGAEPEMFPGPVEVSESFEDVEAERLLLISIGSQEQGRSLWVFDGKTSKYAGIAGLAQSATLNGYGFDATTGRLYALVPHHLAGGIVGDNQIPLQGGLMVVDTRLTPTPQPISFPEFARPGEAAIRIDPGKGKRPTRIFVRRASGTEASDRNEDDSNADEYNRYPDGRFTRPPDERFYLVVEDRLRLGRQPGLADLDRFTTDTEERAGKTQSSFDATGSAYGLRLRLVNGIGAALRNSQLEGIEYIGLQRQGRLPACWGTDRELLVGVSDEARLTNLQANASATGVAINGSTKADLQQPTERCAPPATPNQVPASTVDGLAGREVKASRAECVGDSTDTEAEPQTSRFSATATCEQKKSRVETSSGSVPLAEGALMVAEASSGVEAYRDAERGVVVKSTATARGVAIGNQVTVGLVESVAEVWSNGRPSKDGRATLTRRMCGVTTPSFEQDGCRDPAEAIAAINRVLGNRGRVRMPEPDSEYERGSPKGYVSGITKAAHEVVEDRILNGDTQQEVPALEVIFYRDSSFFGPGRQIAHMAAVRAVTTYGISLLTDGPLVGDAPLEEIPPVDPLPPPRSEAPAVPPDEVAPQQAPPAAAPAPRIARRAAEVLVRSVGEGVLASAVWMTLGLPFVFLSRRSALARTIGRRR